MLKLNVDQDGVESARYLTSENIDHAETRSAAPDAHVIHLTGGGEVSLYDKLNGVWHKRMLQLLIVVVLAHWAEHLAQAWQVYYLGWPRPMAGGFLGLFFPKLVSSEGLHYGYAVVMLAGIWTLRKGFTGTSRKWWTVALWIQFWHHIEHFVLQWQALFHHNWFGSPVPISFLQLAFPKSRIEIHLFYNTAVFIPMMIGMYYHMFPINGEQQASCTCAVQSDSMRAVTA